MDTHNKKKVAKAFLKKIRKFLTLAGALIVFGTFVVKEEWREHLKGLVDSINSAEDVFLIRTENAETARAVNNLRLAVGSKMSTEKGATRNSDNEKTIGAISSTNYTVSNIAILLDTIGRLSEKLPDEPKTKDLLRSYQSQLSTIEKSNERVRELIVPELQAEARGVQLHADGSKNEALKVSEDTLASAASLLTDAWKLERQVLNTAEARKQSDERTYKNLTWASYALYFVGWTLGVLGKLYGIEDPANE